MTRMVEHFTIVLDNIIRLIEKEVLQKVVTFIRKRQVEQIRMFIIFVVFEGFAKA